VLAGAGSLLGPDDRRLTPLVLLVAIARGEGPGADILTSTIGDLLGEPPPTGRHGMVAVGLLGGQALSSSAKWAASHGQYVEPEHLLVCLLDQRQDDVVAAVAGAGIAPEHARESALAALGLPIDEPPVPMVALPPAAPAGTADQPPLPLEALPSDVWSQLHKRNNRAPLTHRWRVWEWDVGRALCNDERYISLLARRRHLNDDQLYSLLAHNRRVQIERRYPGGEPPWSRRKDPGENLLPPGWACWLGNRRDTIADTWERLTRQP
jgi:Clp amino terminal domain, pathogenicity island component